MLISNSTNAGEAYLAYPMPRIGEFLRGVREVAFVPYAAVTFSYADYERRVQARFSELGIRVRSVHRAADPAAMIRRAEADLRRRRQHLRAGQKDAGAGADAGDPQPGEGGVSPTWVGRPAATWPAPRSRRPTTCRSCEPESFRAVGAVKFQINPHYLDANPEGHAGETREQRILEYIEANPRRWVAGLREGCMLRYEEGKLELIGKRPMRMFRKGTETFEIEPGGDLSFLL